MSKKTCRKEPYSFRFVYNFYDEIYPYRGADDLWIETVHMLLQCKINLKMLKWILNIEVASLQRLGILLGVYFRSEYGCPIRYSDGYARTTQPKEKVTSRRLLIKELPILNEILAWAFEVYLLPHPKMNMTCHDPAKKIWGLIAQEYKEVIKRNGGKPDKNSYTRQYLFPIEIMEWGRESVCGAGSKKYLAEKKRKRLNEIRSYRAAHGEEHILLP